MKKCLWLVVLLLSVAGVGRACTTFFLQKDGQMVFGRNYDWVTGSGMVNSNQRGLVKNALVTDGGKSMQWISKFGSVTFNQYGKEFPNGGMNENGLVVELMWLNESQYPAPDSRPGLSVLQWIQYQLDNCATLQEVIATDKQVRIVSNGAPQHYLVADKTGNVATIEFLSGKMVVHQNKDLPYPVLTNSTYESSLKNAGDLQKEQSAGFRDNSIERFAKACAMVTTFKKVSTAAPLHDYAFDILKKVSQPNFTKWSIVYDITNMRVYFKTDRYPQVKSFKFSDMDFACTVTPVAFNMNQSTNGNINNRFVPFAADMNAKMLKDAFTNSREYVSVEPALQESIAGVAAAVKCK